MTQFNKKETKEDKAKKLKYTEREMIQYLYDENQHLRQVIEDLKEELHKNRQNDLDAPCILGHNNYDWDEPLHRMHSFEED